MPDFKNGKIYCIRSHQTDQIYIGSTVQTLCKRMADHRRDYKRYMNGNYHYLTSYDIIKMGDAYIELLEIFPCSCREELHKKEGEYVRNTKCVNKCIPGRTDKEYRENNKDKIAKYMKVWSEKNKDKIAKKGKEYRKNNKDKIAKYKKEYNEKNKVNLTKYKKEWYERNKYNIAKKQKEYSETKKNNIAKRKKEYKKNNKEKIAKKYKEYKEKNRDKINQKRRERYAKKKLEKLSSTDQ